jgi:hypothetical protein
MDVRSAISNVIHRSSSGYGQAPCFPHAGDVRAGLTARLGRRSRGCGARGAEEASLPEGIHLQPVPPEG